MTGTVDQVAERSAVEEFNSRAGAYDNWYRDNPVFVSELAALQAIRAFLPRPALEIGVGPGHFAAALGTEFGLDPATTPLHLAAGRSIIAINGAGEFLPLRSGSTGTVYILFTLCFLADPAAVIRECFRILAPQGRLVLGFIPRCSPWGENIIERGRRQHPLYRFARLQTVAEATRLLEENGLVISEAWSTLLQPPGRQAQPENPLAGSREDAGFCVLVSGRKGVEL